MTVVIAAAVCNVTGRGAAAESTADWLKRILDPTTIGVEPFPGSKLNRKITVDTIRYSDPAKRIAVYMVPTAQTSSAVEHFTKAFGVEPTKDGSEDQGTRRFVFQLTGAGTFPAAAKGLEVVISRSPWVDDMAQIQMTFTPPGAIP
jgi:hypothetical protein